jgi:hypothetical protein
LVVFPRTWEKYQFALEIGGVILAEGKVDAQSSPPKVLVEAIRTEIKLTEPAQNGTGKEASQMVLQPQRSAPARKPAAPSPKHVGETPPAYRKPIAPDDEPPEDPPDWENYQPGEASFAVHDLVMHAADLPEEQPLAIGDRSSAGEPVSGNAQSPTLNPQSPISQFPPVILATPKLPAASIPVRLDDEHPPQMLTVILRPSGDAQRDIRRISRLHGTFISYPGKDRFAFQIFEEGRGHLIEFPNDTTHLCPELLITIKDAVGEENLRVEPILYQ